MSRGSVMHGSTHWPAVRFEAAPKVSVLFFSGLLGAAIPLILSLYWIGYWQSPDSVGPLLRVFVVGCAVPLGLFWYRAPLSHAEISLFRVLGVTAIAWLIPSFMATDPLHALSVWLRLILLFVICCFAIRGLRHPPTAYVFGVALLVGAGILILFVLFIWVRSKGYVMPTYKTAREFKGIAILANVPLNPIAFGTVMSYLMGLCLVRANLFLILMGIPLLFVCSAFTGSRAPLVILCASVFVFLSVKGLRNKWPRVRIATALVVAGAALGGIVIVSATSDNELREATEGRSHLWSVGLQKFVERPLFGYGLESWRDDLVSRLPGEYVLTYELARVSGGGYHNEYISVLAEEGLIGAFGAALIVWLLLRSSWLLAFRRWAALPENEWPLFATIFLLLRANFELPGLFGDGRDPADYLAYLLLAIVLSRFSVEEDYARSLAQSGNGSGS